MVVAFQASFGSIIRLVVKGWALRIGVDTNQLSGSHGASNHRNHKWLLENGHGLTPLPVPYGDYIEITPEIQEIIDARGEKLMKKDLLGHIKVSIDRKNSIDEACGNICGKQHERFRNECIRAQDDGARFYILIENTEGIKDLDGIERWSNPRLHRYNKIRYMHRLGKWQTVSLPPKPPTSNMTLLKAMRTMASKYGVIWVLCSPHEAARRIVELLNQ